MTEMYQSGPSPENTPQPRPEIPLPLAVRHFVEELSLLQDAGLPLLRSLHIAEGVEPNAALKTALRAVGEEVEGGSSLSEAMKKFPEVFDSRLVMFVNAGEVGGVLDIALKRASEMLDWHEMIPRTRTPDFTTVELRQWANSLGHLIGIGVPILTAVEESKLGMSPNTAAGIEKVKLSIREGEGMASAMRQSPGVFDPVLIQFVDIGEETGDLDQVLLRFAKRSETLTH